MTVTNGPAAYGSAGRELELAHLHGEEASSGRQPVSPGYAHALLIIGFALTPPRRLKSFYGTDSGAAGQ